MTPDSVVSYQDFRSGWASLDDRPAISNNFLFGELLNLVHRSHVRFSVKGIIVENFLAFFRAILKND